MFDNMTSEICTILSTSICGVSLATILGMIIYIIKLVMRNKKNLQITTKAIEEAFKNAVIPKTIRLDISNKIEQPIKEGLLAISNELNSHLEELAKGEQMMLKILMLLTHFQKLPDDVREEIENFVNLETTVMDVKI